MRKVDDVHDPWETMRETIINRLVDKILMSELIAELRDEIREESEAFVITKCQNVYRRLMMTGPFTTKDTRPGEK